MRISIREKGEVEVLGKGIRWVGLLPGILLIAAGCMATPQGEIPKEGFKLGEAVSIEGVNVSRMAVAEARIAAEQAARLEIEGLTFTLSLEGLPEVPAITLTGAQLPILADVEGALRQASYLTQYKPIGQESRALNVATRLDETAMAKMSESLADEFFLAAKDATAAFDRGTKGLFLYTEGEAGRRVSPKAITAALAGAVAAGESQNIRLPYETVPPAYTAQMAREDHSLIATFETSFAKSPHNAAGRVFNIRKAASLIDGVTVQPGDDFDMNAILGPRNDKTGWKTAPGIRDGKYEQEYGGGVCQVSSTLFNAVMMADLTITERRPHSWPLTYVDIGRDATISTGGPNFRFVNNGEREIVVAAETTKNKKVIVSIYGRPLPHGGSIKISSKATGRLPALGVKKLLDESLPYATTVEERKERRGRTSVTYKNYYDAEGNFVKREIAFEDKYRSIQGITYVSSDLYYSY